MAGQADRSGQGHTPGPWAYSPTAGQHDYSVYAEGGGRGDVALVRDFHEGNARLIAAAPELLRLLGSAFVALPNAAHNAGLLSEIKALLLDIGVTP